MDEHVDLRRWVAKIELENEQLHERMGYWRERAGLLEECLHRVEALIRECLDG